jgi:tRNA G18 (ribose-2'-O)-methylase SpoU
VKSELTLVGLDIEGEWNIPLLRNAAALSGASLVFARGRDLTETPHTTAEPVGWIDEVLGQYDCVFACEATEQSRSVYECPAPRGHLGLIVGNERTGVPHDILKRVSQVVSIPMFGQGMSSVNVAVAAAIVLYVTERDLARKRLRTSTLSHRDVDVLLVGPPNPSEIGSLLRSAWAFGWQRLFLSDPHGVWFTKDRETVLASRAAARGEVNRIVVRPWEQLNLRDYEQVVVCSGSRNGTPLSRFTLPDRGTMLLVYGDDELPLSTRNSCERIYVDHRAAAVNSCYRHSGSILLTMIAQRLRRGRHG